MESKELKTYIVTLCHRQFLNYLRENKIPENDPNYVYLHNANQLMGVHTVKEIIYEGTWYDKKSDDLTEIMEMAKCIEQMES